MRVFETYQEGKDALIKYIKENKKDKSPLIIAIGSSQQHAGKTTLSKDLIETLYKDGIIIRGTTDYDNQDGKPADRDCMFEVKNIRITRGFAP